MARKIMWWAATEIMGVSDRTMGSCGRAGTRWLSGSADRRKGKTLIPDAKGEPWFRTSVVADAYSGTRVAKFNKNGKFFMDWGKLGGPPRGPIDTRPGYFSNVHGVAVD